MLCLIALPFGRLVYVPWIASAGKTASLLPFDVLLGFLVIACLAAYVSGQLPPHRSLELLKVVILFVGWSAITLPINSIYFHIGLKNTVFGSLYLVRWAECVAFFYAAGVLIAEQKISSVELMKWLFSGAIAFAVFGFFQAIFFSDFALMLNPQARPYIDYDPQGHRLVSGFLDPNIAAGYLLFFSVIALSFYLTGSRRWLPVLVTLILALLLTLSRGGILGFITASSVLLLLMKRIRLSTVLKPVGAMLLIGVLLYPLVAPQLEEAQRVSLTDESAMMRITAWLFAFELVRDNPVLGIGFNTFGYVSPLYGREREGALSFGFEGDLLVILVLTGLAGFLLYLRIYAHIYQTAKLQFRQGSVWDQALARGVVSGTVGLLVSSCFSSIVLYPQIMAAMWTAWAVVYSRYAASAAIVPRRSVSSTAPSLYEAFQRGLILRLPSQEGVRCGSDRD
jgi:hypothetical protein